MALLPPGTSLTDLFAGHGPFVAQSKNIVLLLDIVELNVDWRNF